jgi:hypothetical protein
MKKAIKIQAEQIGDKWYVVGDGLKMPVPSQEHAIVISNYLMTTEVPDPNFNPGRRKKSV